MAARKKGRGKRKRMSLAGLAQVAGLGPYPQTPIGLERFGTVVAPWGASGTWFRAWREGMTAGYLFLSSERADEGHYPAAYEYLMCAYQMRFGGRGKTMWRRHSYRAGAPRGAT